MNSAVNTLNLTPAGGSWSLNQDASEPLMLKKQKNITRVLTVVRQTSFTSVTELLVTQWLFMQQNTSELIELSNINKVSLV